MVYSRHKIDIIEREIFPETENIYALKHKQLRKNIKGKDVVRHIFHVDCMHQDYKLIFSGEFELYEIDERDFLSNNFIRRIK